MTVSTIHTCEVGSFPPDNPDSPTLQYVTPDQLQRCGKPATLRDVHGRFYWLCDTCAAIDWPEPVRTAPLLRIQTAGQPL